MNSNQGRISPLEPLFFIYSFSSPLHTHFREASLSFLFPAVEVFTSKRLLKLDI